MDFNSRWIFEIWIFVLLGVVAFIYTAFLIVTLFWITVRQYVFLHVNFSPFTDNPPTDIPILPRHVKRYLRRPSPSPVARN